MTDITNPIDIFERVTWSLKTYGRMDFRRIPTDSLIYAALRASKWGPENGLSSLQMNVFIAAFEEELICRTTFTKKNDELHLGHVYLQNPRFTWSATMHINQEVIKELTRRYRRIVKGACIDDQTGETWLCSSHDAVLLMTPYRRVK